MENDKSDLMSIALPVGAVLHSKGLEYSVDRVLGAGGFGITYLVSRIERVGGQEMKREQYAVKEHVTKGCERADDRRTLTVTTASKNDFVSRKKDFEHEAKRLIEVGGKSVNIVKVYEWFEENGTSYYRMEYLDGGSLLKYVRTHGGAQDEKKALSVMIPVIRAVKLLHSGENRLLHLDIKPDNIVMKTRRDGVLYPVLIDFGSAKHFDRKGRPTSQPVAKGLTAGYAPTEQSQPITQFDARLDVYALGATLFFMLTGRDPLPAYELNVGFLKENLSMVSEKTRDAVIRAMRKDKDDRTESCDALLDDLEDPHTLPIYYVLKSPNQKYRILEVLKETPYSVEYKAMPAYTVDFVEDNESYKSHQTESIGGYYVVVELFEQDCSRRNPDGSICITYPTTRAVPPFFMEARKCAGLQFDGQEPVSVYKNNWLVSEGFRANGTVYYVYRQDKPLGLLKGIGLSVVRHKKMLAGVMALSALAYGIFWYMNRPGPSESELLTSAINTGSLSDLKRYAEADSVRAYLPYAELEFDRKNYDVAKQFAKKALNISSRKNYDVAKQFAKKALNISSVKDAATSLLAKIDATLLAAQVDSISIVSQQEEELTEVEESSVPDGKEETPQTTVLQSQPQTNADRYRKAMADGDWSTVKELADKGFSKAYLPLAKHYLENSSTHSLADKYARKGMSVNESEANEIISVLRNYGYYD